MSFIVAAIFAIREEERGVSSEFSSQMILCLSVQRQDWTIPLANFDRFDSRDMSEPSAVKEGGMKSVHERGCASLSWDFHIGDFEVSCSNLWKIVYG